jgi:ribose transport system ATP-binding protein
MRAIFGASRAEGEVYVNGKLVHIREPNDAIAAGIGFLPEDRKIQGLLRELSVKLNITVTSLERMGKWGFMDYGAMNKASRKYVDLLDIAPPQPDRLVRNLSGGNQQKVVLARWLCAGSQIVIFDEPTRGIDVGAKAEIYALMEELAGQGKSIIMVSSELPEVLRMSHRILVMREGAIVKELPRSAATKENIMYYATGGQ